jgi:hypothetical protein
MIGAGDRGRTGDVQLGNKGVFVAKRAEKGRNRPFPCNPPLLLPTHKTPSSPALTRAFDLNVI